MLLQVAPHIIWPLRFVLPHHRGLRPACLIRLGLFLYDHLGGRKILPPSQSVDLRSRSGRRAAQAGVHARLRVFRLLGRRCAAGRAQCTGCRRTAARTSAFAPRSSRARRKDGSWEHRSRGHGDWPAIDGRRRGSSSMRPGLGWAMCSAASPIASDAGERAAGQGQPHRRAKALRPRRGPTSFRTPTGASSLPFPIERRLHAHRHHRRRL